MSTSHFSDSLPHFVQAKLATSNMRVKVAVNVSSSGKACYEIYVLR